MSVDDFIAELSNVKFDNAFNPYAERCELFDVDDAPGRRRTLLRDMLQAASRIDVDSVWIGRDLGYRGGRRTGLALTDDVHLGLHASRWGVKCDRATKGQAVAERTAAVIWRMLQNIDATVFLWNVFPLHPFEAGDPFSNRSHNANEKKAGEELLAMLLELLNPRTIVAIGNDAERTALRFQDGRSVVKVRHPSYGGQNIFIKQIESIYDVRKAPSTAPLFDLTN